MKYWYSTNEVLGVELAILSHREEDNESLSNFNHSSIQNSALNGDICGGGIGRTLVDSGSSYNWFLIIAFGIPYVTDGPMRSLREAFLSMVNNVPQNKYDCYPLFPSFTMSIKILVWNV